MSSSRLLAAAAAGLSAVFVGFAAADVIYVDHAATGANTGNNWTDAYTFLSSAFAAASDGDEIWIAEGRYTPPPNSWWIVNDTIDIYGGFVSGATDINDRDPVAHRTILDADINQDDGPDHTNKADNAPGILKIGAETNVLGDIKLSGLVIKNSGSRSAVIAYATLLDIDTCRFSGNLSTVDIGTSVAGAAIRFMNGNQIRILDSVFINNRCEAGLTWATRGYAAAVFVQSHGDQVVIRRSEFRDNVVNSTTSATGGALYLNVSGNNGGTAAITDCVFVGNSVIGEAGEATGGAFYLFGAASTVVRDCLFDSNTVSAVLDVESGGVYIDSDTIEMTRCDFIGNHAEDRGTTGNTVGGGAFLASDSFQGRIDVQSCRFLGNVCDRAHGGGLVLDMPFQSPPLSARVINSFFSGNRAGLGGGLYSEANLEVINSTFVGNDATAAPAEARGGAIYAENASNIYDPPVMNNSIMWGNTSTGGLLQAAQIYSNFPAVDINHCIVEGWTGNLGGVGNSGSDPLFANPDGFDDVFGTPDDQPDVIKFSPAIDQGDNGVLPADTGDLDDDGDTAELIPLDISGQPRLHDDVDIAGVGAEPNVDIGASEFQRRSCPADLDVNGILDLFDINAFVTAFSAMDPAADLDGNGVLDLFDIVFFIGIFNAGCP